MERQDQALRRGWCFGQDNLKTKYPITLDELKAFVESGRTAQDMADIKAIPRKAVYELLHRAKMKTRRPRHNRHLLTLEQEKEAVELYVHHRWAQERIGKCYGVQKGIISLLLRKRGVKMRDYSDYRLYQVNHGYFDVIDTEPKAYWLGMLFADGCVMQRKYQKLVHLGLQKRDAYHVEAFRDILYPNHDCQVRPARNQVRIVASSDQMFDALHRLGCVPRKSLTLQFPTATQVPEHLIRHFIRGYFDGDGCIFWKPRGGTVVSAVSIVSSVPFCRALCEKLNETVGVFHFFFSHDNPKTGGVRASRQDALLAFHNYMYAGATVWLKRKREHYDRFIVALTEIRARKEAA